MFDPLKYLQLTWLILSRGHLKHSGEDFNRKREESLKNLQDFIPGRSSVPNTTIPQNAIIRNVIAQLSFIKNSFKTKGGHLTVSDLTYIRIPKAASTSMCKEILEKMYPTLRQKGITETQLNFLTDIHLQKDISKPTTCFTIVRNPFARLVSVYRDLFENPEHYIYRDYLFGILPQQISFSAFVERINSIPDRLKDQHIKPQHLFLKSYEQKSVEVRIFKLEDPDALNDFLNRYNVKLPHLNKSGEAYDYQSYYNSHTLKKAFKIYHTDVQQFGYEKEYQKLLEYTNKH